MAEESRSRRYYQPERKRIRSNSTGTEVERRDLMRGMGDKEDRGASVTDLRARAAGTNATPESPAMAALKARNPGATPWQPGGAGGAAPFRGSTGAEVADFYAGVNPGAAAARSGQTVTTPQGTVGVRFARQGEVMQPAQATATGVVRADPLNWQQAIVQQHPAIGIAGSQANLEFVRAYKAAQAGGGQVDPNTIAQNVIQNITQPKAEATMPQGIAQADISAPPAIGGELAKTTFGGVEMPSGGWNSNGPESEAMLRGKRAAAAGQAAKAKVVNPIVAGAKKVGRVINEKVNNVQDYWAGLQGKPSGSRRWEWTKGDAPAIPPPAPAPEFKPPAFTFEDPQTPSLDHARAKDPAPPKFSLGPDVQPLPTFDLNDDEQKKKRFAGGPPFSFL